MEALASLLWIWAAQAGTGPFDPGCVLPFADIALKHPIDEQCDRNGLPEDPNTGLQDIVKNNFCAAGAVTELDIADFVKLQGQVEARHIPFGRSNLPGDRAGLAALVDASGVTVGEGRLVSLTGYIVDAHYADVNSGESVNCKLVGDANNDIHFSVSPNPAVVPARGPERTRMLCGMATAEVTPHFRPAAWELATLGKIEKEQRPVRVTGQLFFDASHVPCRNGVIRAGNPARDSLWEIHPVYSIEVCLHATISECGTDAWKRLATVAASVVGPRHGRAVAGKKRARE